MSLDLFRQYAPDELGADGYPPEWHRIPLTAAPWEPGVFYAPGDGLKHIVRKLAEDRCVRCGHPYTTGAGEWSSCDAGCTHAGPIRWRTGENSTGWFEVTEERDAQGWPPGSMVQTTRLAVAPYALGAVEARWRILTVHHLDNDKANCCWWNLAALCQRCHLQIQGKVQMARVWPWEHTAWFRPYVAGFYAHAYLGEDLTRAEVEDRLEELLALERVA